MKIYPRILESGPREIENVAKVATVTVGAGRRRPAAGITRIQGVLERHRRGPVPQLRRGRVPVGRGAREPVRELIQNGNDSSASCFCEFCRARGKANGIDAERARQGFVEMVAYIRALREARSNPPTARRGFLRILLRYPEILAWEYQYRLSREEVMKGMYDTIKESSRRRPSAGTSITGRPAWTPSRARNELRRDGAVVRLPQGRRLSRRHRPARQTWVANMQRSMLGDLTLEEALDLHYDLFGYDRALERRRTSRRRRAAGRNTLSRNQASVAQRRGQDEDLSGIGFNVPSPPDDPETIYQAVRRRTKPAPTASSRRANTRR